MSSRDRLRSWRARLGQLIAPSAALALLIPATASAAIDKEQVVANTFTSPVHVAQPPGNSTRLFVVEQDGTVRLIKNGTLLGTPFLDIEDVVNFAGEQGLLSIAFPPNYGSGAGSTTRRFYVYFTNNNGDERIKEYKRSKASGDVAAPSYSRTVLGIPHPTNENHNGGQLQFGPDGFLFAAPGDGGSGNDPPNNAQNKNSLLGKLLRISPLPSGSKNHTNPPGNPFAGPTPGLGEIFSLGLRNPWRFSFDGQTLSIGDVGQGAWEEIDQLPRTEAKGANFGWSYYEGFEVNPNGNSDPIANHTAPVLVYPNPLTGPSAVVGGYIVRDAALTELAGRYVYTDTYAGVLRSFDPSDPDGTDAAVGASVSLPSSFGVDNADRVYVTSLGDGRVYRLIQTP